jgi:glyoxylase-like metal-dependent hydrolase (beta-lactamase superfamily II)
VSAKPPVTDLRVVGPFAENAYLLACARTREAVLIDPGDEPERIQEMIRAHDVHVLAILATHGHLDHVGAAAPLCAALGVPFRMHAADRFLLDALVAQAQAFGLDPPEPPQIDQPLEDGDVIAVGDLSVRVLHTPGHSPGGVSLVAGRVLFPGDALFFGSIGRTDLPGGDHQTLMASIRGRLLSLGDGMRVLPGHGPETTLGFEREHNPFLL